MRIVSIELLESPLRVKNKILRIKNITKLNIEYIAGKNIVFNTFSDLYLSVNNTGEKELPKCYLRNYLNLLIVVSFNY